MTRFVRRQRRLRHWAVLVLLVAGWGVPLCMPHVSNDDVLCVVDGVAENAQARLDASTVRTPSEHCVICHAARTFRAGLSEGKPVALGLAPGTVVPDTSAVPHVRSIFGPLPARAPPLA